MEDGCIPKLLLNFYIDIRHYIKCLKAFKTCKVFFVVLVFECRALYLLGIASTTWARLLATLSFFFLLYYFWIGSYDFALVGLDCLSLVGAFCVARRPGICQHTQLTSWDGVLITFCPGWSWTIILMISTSPVAELQVWATAPALTCNIFSSQHGFT
jgi:hypothetical protein